MTTTKSIRVEFGGGLELLFSNQKSHKVDIPTTATDDNPTDIKYLILWLKDHLLTEREELFLDGNTVYVHLLRVSCALNAYRTHITGDRVFSS
jgi:hypothetical protein